MSDRFTITEVIFIKVKGIENGHDHLIRGKGAKQFVLCLKNCYKADKVHFTTKTVREAPLNFTRFLFGHRSNRDCV